MISEINTWLQSGCNYLKGVELYQNYGANKTLQALFSKSQTSFTTTKLKQELQKLVALSKPQVHSETKTPAPSASYPEPVCTWYKQAMALLDINKDRKTRMGLLVEEALQKFNPETELNKLNKWLLDKGSEQMVHEHLNSCFEESKLWEKISIWRKTGKLPEPEPKIPAAIELMDMHNLILRRNVLRSRISQCKRRNPPRKFNKEARLEFRTKNKKMLLDYIQELTLIETRINELV